MENQQSLPDGDVKTVKADSDTSEVLEDRTSCSFCHEPIHRDAKKCRWCNEWLAGRHVEAPPDGSNLSSGKEHSAAFVLDEPLMRFKKVSLGSMIVLSLLTLGLYTPYWLWTRRDTFNELRGGVVVGNGPLIAYYMILPLAWLNGIASIDPAYATSGTAVFFSLVGWFGYLFALVTFFGMRRALTAHCERGGASFRLSGAMTFFFNIFYLQHAINKLQTRPRH